MNGWAKQTQNGFTIVELLIVIVVIGILAAITIVAFNGIQQRARTTAVYDSMQKMEKSLKAYAVTTGDDAWPRETAFLGTGNPSLNSIAADARYRDFIKAVDTTHGLSSSTAWLYDNDGDTASSCGTGQGVAIFISDADPAAEADLDSRYDDGVANCGKIRYSGTTLFYQLSLNEATL